MTGGRHSWLWPLFALQSESEQTDGDGRTVSSGVKITKALKTLPFTHIYVTLHSFKWEKNQNIWYIFKAHLLDCKKNTVCMDCPVYFVWYFLPQSLTLCGLSAALMKVDSPWGNFSEGIIRLLFNLIWSNEDNNILFLKPKRFQLGVLNVLSV